MEKLERNSRQEFQPSATKKTLHDRYGKGGVNPHEIAIRLKTLFANVAVQNRDECLFLLTSRRNISLYSIRSELSLTRYGSEEKQFNNLNSTGTFVTSIPSNGKVYIIATSQMCRKYTCELIGPVHDCYVIRSRSIHEPMKAFEEQVFWNLWMNVKKESNWRDWTHLKKKKIILATVPIPNALTQHKKPLHMVSYGGFWPVWRAGH